MTHVIIAAVLALHQVSGLVERTFAGDTLVVAPRGEPTRWIRLVGVGVPSTPDASKPDPFFGQLDPPALARWLEGRPVTLMAEPRLPNQKTRLDLAYAHAGPKRADVGLELIRAGWAYVRQDQDFVRKDEYLLAEAEARAAGRGYWPMPAPPEPEPTPTKRPANLVASLATDRGNARLATGHGNGWVAPSGKEATAARTRAAERARRRRAYYRAHGAQQAGLRAQMWGQLNGAIMTMSISGGGGGGDGGKHWVNSHTKGDGTFVKGHWRSNPSY